ncbi:uncharacterized protein LOC126894712 [Daktulosphaira vitifoliae]|uniref:uncharacterized protein LOC126894712 n=1 Tax=Daktulosphaira vitifoliae TaxID=58002 RepID=UPI0021AAF476|nr:uncharacterized protein LOC126894712 [Daktulosphaira vitifoliae]
MILKIFTAILFLLCIVKLKKCYGIKFWKTKDESLERVLKLDTGFEYPSYEDLCNLSLEDFKNKIFPEDNSIRGNYLKRLLIKSKTHFIRLDLICGNTFNFLQYLNLISSLIELPSGQTYDINRIILNESITKQILVILTKYNPLKKNDAFWAMHFYTSYIRIFGNEIYQYPYNIVDTHLTLRSMLIFVSFCMCRDNNKYDVRGIPSVISEQYSTLTNLLDVMNQRREINKNVLEIVDKEESAFSLRSIYMCDIIEKKELLRTAIMDFGEQSKDTFDAIYNDIHKAYKAAKNYFKFDLWIKRIGVYQRKVLNVFKTILMHLMKKHFIYSYLLLDNEQIDSAKFLIEKIANLFQKMTMLFDGVEARDFQKILKSFTNLPSDNKNFIYYHGVLISNIVCIIDKIKSNSFKLISNDLIRHPDYESNIHIEIKMYILRNDLDENELKNIQYLWSISDSKGMNDNFVRIYLFTKLINKLFHNISIISILSCLKFCESFEIQSLNNHGNVDYENEERVLEL